MATRTGHLCELPIHGADLPNRSAGVMVHDHLQWDVRIRDAALLHGWGARTPVLPVESAAASRNGYRAHSYYDDFYNRIHVRPAALALGNIASDQDRDLIVWNAYDSQSVTITAAESTDADIVVQGAFPQVIAPLREAVFRVGVSTAGSPVINAKITITFEGMDGRVVPVTGNRVLAWPVPCDWGSRVDETLEWKTDVQHAINGSRTAIPLRGAPRCGLDFDVIADRAERRVLEAMLHQWAGRTWVLPIWPDVEWLSEDLPAGATSIPLRTAGSDLHADGMLMLWSAVDRYELVRIDSVQADAVTLAGATTQAWPRGSRAWPCRMARMESAPTMRRLTDRLVAMRCQFRIDEPADWPAVHTLPLYAGFPVLSRGDESTDPESAFDRQLVVLDGDVGLVHTHDPSGHAWQRQSHAWRLYGRAERTANRSLLYWLQGRAQSLWVPSYMDDLQLALPTTSIADALIVRYAGASAFSALAPGRRHMRIELWDGRVFHRRAAAVAQFADGTERVELDTPLGEVLQPQQVRQISWMALCAQGNDRITITHHADLDGLADVQTSFVATPQEEP